LLASAPAVLAWFLFDPLPPMTLTEDGESVQVTQSIENIELAYRARADSFGVELKRLRDVCARASIPGLRLTRIMIMPSTCVLGMLSV
jgi:hypothetical protein